MRINDPEVRKKFFRLTIFLAAILLIVKYTRPKDENLSLYEINGITMGTIGYSVKYLHTSFTADKKGVDSVLAALNQAHSTYIENSEISIFNRRDTLFYESDLFYPVLALSAKIHDMTSGAFDPTVGPLINAYGFGPGKQPKVLTDDQIDSLRRLVDFSKINFNSEYAVKPSGFYLDFSAIAKGYAVDLVAAYLHDKGIQSFMIEIGGEVITRGVNDKKKPWSIGIENPLVPADVQEIYAIVSLENLAVATSGNYRQYYERNGKLFAHIIDPRTGLTAQNGMLSVSVFADNCMEADAYATAFMVMGLDGIKEVLQKHGNLDVMVIYRPVGEDKEQVYISERMKDKIRLTNL